MAADADPPAIDLLVVTAGGRRFGLMARDVLEVQRMVACEPLPGAPEAVEGVIDVRGHVVPMLVLAERLGLASRPPRISDHLVLTRSRRHVVAIRTEHALGLESVAPDRLTGSHEVAPVDGRVRGLVRLSDGLLVIVDLDAFLGWEESAALRRAMDAARGAAAHG